MHNIFLGIVLFLATWFTAPSCKVMEQNKISDLKITNPREAGDKFPAVVLLVADGSPCTGTFVSRTTIITAAHCTQSRAYAVIDGKMILADKNIPHPEFVRPREPKVPVPPAEQSETSLNDYQKEIDEYKEFQKEAHAAGRFDLGVLVFNQNVGPEPGISFYEGQPTTGQKVEIVGFGLPSFLGDKKGWGENTIYSVEDGFIYLIGEKLAPWPAPNSSDPVPGTNSAGAAGDSGGPLFISGKLAGITTGSHGFGFEDKTRQHTFYVDLTTETSRLFLKEAKSQGADIPSP